MTSSRTASSAIQYLGDLSEPSVFNDGAIGEREAQQEYYIAFAQDEWKVSPSVTLNYGLRYEYYTPLREARDLAVLFDIDRGVLKPSGTTLYKSKTNNFQPRVGRDMEPRGQRPDGPARRVRHLRRPGQTEDQIQPIESDRISTTVAVGAFPVDAALLRANFVNNPDNRSYQPRAYANDYTIPERIYSYSVSVQQELPWKMVATAGYVGSQGRNLFLRSWANKIVGVSTNADPTKNAVVIREFDIVNGSSIERPYAEIDYKTSGGKDSYNALQMSLARRFSDGLTLNSQYTFGRSYGNTAGSNEALTSGNPFDFDYDIGYNRFDVRHTYNISALYSLPFGRGRKFMGGAGGVSEALLGGWDVGAILNGRSGLPIDVQVVRPDVAYVDGLGNVFTSPADGRTAVINTSRRRRIPQRPAAEPRAGCQPVPQGRSAMAQPGGVQRAGAGRVRQPAARIDTRPELPPGRRRVREALRAAGSDQHRSTSRGVQPLQP